MLATLKPSPALSQGAILATLKRSPALGQGGVAKRAAEETLIFVDVDGVLNVAIGDPGRASMEYGIENLERALSVWSRRHTLPADVRACVERIVSVRSRKSCSDEACTYAELLSAHNSLSDLAVGRLVQLIQTAGERCKVVLSSTWRQPRHSKKLRWLEEALSRHLGRPFAFHDRTGLNEEHSAEGRLRCIGDYVAKYCTRDELAGSHLRVMLLEDFHISPLGSWTCGGRRIGSASDVEDYLRDCTPDSVSVSAKLIHTYEEWRTTSGLRVQVGSGLTRAHISDALYFLGSMQKEPARADISEEAGRNPSSQFVVTTV